MTRIVPLEGKVNTTGRVQEGLADGFAANLLAGLKAGADENGRAVFRLGGFGELIVEPAQLVFRRADARWEALAGTPAVSVKSYRFSLYRFSEADSERINEVQALRLLEAHKRRLVTKAMVDLALSLQAALDGASS